MKAVITVVDLQNHRIGRDITITFVGNDRSFAQSYLNVNAFPNALHKNVESAASRFAMFHYQLKLLHSFLGVSQERLVKHINAPKLGLEKVLLQQDSSDRFVVKYDAIEVLTALHGLFYVLKSFLDVYSQLLCSAVAPKQSMSFKRRMIGDRTLAGGTFIRWLRTSCPASFLNANSLADYIEGESAAWITEAVAHRDTLGHFSDIEDIHALQVPLNRIRHPGEPMIDFGKLQPPKMPNGQVVEDYILELGQKLRRFVAETLGMLPDLKHNLLHFRDFDIDEPLWPEGSNE